MTESPRLGTEPQAATSADAATDRTAADDEAAMPRPREPLIHTDLLVEDVSIDGMCGVY